MTKDQKSAFKSLKKTAHRRAFVELLSAQQHRMGKFNHWTAIYDRKCRQKGTKNPVA